MVFFGNGNLLSRVIICLRAGSVLREADQQAQGWSSGNAFYPASQGTAKLVHRRPEQGQFLITRWAVTDLLIAPSVFLYQRNFFKDH